MNDWFAGTRWLTKLGAAALMLGGATSTFLTAPKAAAQEANACLSTDPSHWPAPSKPYFMIAFDTSGSMDADVGSGSSCNFTSFSGNSSRLAHGKCAIKNTLLAFAGEANFGLASYARTISSCDDGNGNWACSLCNFGNLPGNSSAGNTCGGGSGCGPEPTHRLHCGTGH